MDRRALLRCALASAILPIASRAAAQSPAEPPRVVLVLGGTEASAGPFAESFVEGMRQAGHVRGRTVRIDVRFAAFEGVRALINEVVAERPAVLVVGGLTAARYARDATQSVPVVVGTSSDLAAAGIVQSLARPGGNVTGITDLTDETTAKRLELTRAALPDASRVVLLVNPEFPATARIEARAQAAASALRLKLSSLSARDRASLEQALDSLVETRPDALVATDALAVQLAARLIERATALRVPVVHFWPGTAEQGALLSYQADVHDNFRRAAGYVDRILKGARAQDLAVYQSARYELVVNAKAARALGLTLSAGFLARADRVIE
jgi:putative ABC transport system substrate-binding protein